MAENLIRKISLSDTNAENLSSEETETPEECLGNLDNLPSGVTDKEYIYTPRSYENFEDGEEWKNGGKWLIFSHVDLEKLDSWWIQLQPLLANKTFVYIKSSTARNPEEGVIMCYTPDHGDKEAVKKAADAIRNVVDVEYLMYYKTNEATEAGLYRKHGDNEITKYMHTVACSLYERCKNKGWRKV